MKPWLLIASIVVASSSLAAAAPAPAPSVRVEPAKIHPGDPVLITVTKLDHEPKGTAGATELQFFRTKAGYQAVFAVPLVEDGKPVTVKITGITKPLEIAVVPHTFPETDVVVEEELASPQAEERKQIDADNAGMLTAMRAATEPMFTRGFVRPRGKITSVFGEWRTFNDGHRSQHLGFDVMAKEGTKIAAVNRGTVSFVGSTFLGGNVVVVSHGAGISSTYMHMSEMSVAVGDTVERGGILGKSGSTGRTTGPHIHVSIRVPGGFVDPPRFFGLKLAPAPVTAAKP